MADTRYSIRPEYTGPYAALSLGLTLLKKAKANTWSEMTAALDTPDSPIAENLAKVVLSDEQIQILDDSGEVLRYLKIAPPVQVATGYGGSRFRGSETAFPIAFRRHRASRA